MKKTEIQDISTTLVDDFVDNPPELSNNTAFVDHL